MIETVKSSSALPEAPPRSGLLVRARESRTLLLGAGIWAVLVLNFTFLGMPGSDSAVQFTFVERVFGDTTRASGYYFGLGLVEVPFYGLGKVLDALGLHTVSGHRVEETATTLGLGLLTLAAWPLLVPVIRGLSLRFAGSAILAAALGTPFFYYATFLPGKDHTIDALLFTGAIYLTFRYFRTQEPEQWLPFALGALLGFACTVRWFNGAEAIGLCAMLLVFRRYRHAIEVAATLAVVSLVLFQIPRALSAPVFTGGPQKQYKPENVLTFAPLNPFRMLFSDHRGYFVWSPVALLAVVGLVFLFRRRPEHRRFLATTVLMSVGVITSYTLVPFWDGGWSFGQRFYTPLFPVVAIGLAGLFDAVPRRAGVAAAAAVAWSIYLCLNLATIGGPQYILATPGGASDLAAVPFRTNTSPGAYAYGVWSRSNLLRPLFSWPGVGPSSAGRSSPHGRASPSRTGG